MLSKFTLMVSAVFWCYALLVILKKMLGFQDGMVDVLLLMLLSVFILMKPGRLVNAFLDLLHEKSFKVFLIFILYYCFLALFSFNTFPLIFLEFLSVFKWAIYFFIGFLFARIYSVKELISPAKYSFCSIVFFVLIYSILNYNWSGVGGVSNLFGFYENSFESLFSLRSVFSLFGFVVLVYGINILSKDKVAGIFLIMSSLIFMFMSGNRKILIAVLLITLLIHFRLRVANVLKYIVAILVCLMMLQTVLFEKSMEEYSNPSQPRISLYLVSYQIARDNFPFGSGPATFGSKGSMVNYSPIYKEYGLDKKWGFRENDDTSFYNDTYWAQIIGQYGVLGLVLVLLIQVYMGRLVVSKELTVSFKKQLFVLALISIATPALQRVEIALFIFFVMGMYSQFRKPQNLIGRNL